MNPQLMILPARESENIRLLRIPDDMEEHEAFRYATGVIAAAQEAGPNSSWEDLADALEEHGFEIIEFVMGPELD